MKQHVDKRLVVIMLLVALMVVPWPTEARGSKERDCKIARRWEYLAASTAFVMAFTPFTPVAIAYGVVALGAKAYEVMYLDC